MDLSSLTGSISREDGSWLHLEHPVTGLPLFADDDEKTKPVRILLLGKDSESYRAAKHTKANDRLKKLGGGSSIKITAESLEDDATFVLASVTKNFENVILDGQEVAFSKFNARRLYEDHQWIREQVDAFVSDRGNFLGESSQS